MVWLLIGTCPLRWMWVDTPRCDVYRPVEDGKYPVILSYGPYGKWLHFEDGYVSCWQRMAEEHQDVTANSTNQYQQCGKW